jgi:hypothetical protein
MKKNNIAKILIWIQIFLFASVGGKSQSNPNSDCAKDLNNLQKLTTDLDKNAELNNYIENDPSSINTWEIVAKASDPLSKDKRFIEKLHNRVKRDKELISDLTDLDLYEAAKEALDSEDPNALYELLKENNPDLFEKVLAKIDNAKSEMFKNFAKGRTFEKDMLDQMKNRSGPAYTSLALKVTDIGERRLLSQVQFCLPTFPTPCSKEGEFFIADQVWVKYNQAGQIVDMVIVEVKLSSNTPPTKGQGIASGAGSLVYKPVEPRSFDFNGLRLPSDITTGTSITKISFLKLYSDGNGLLPKID